MLEFITEHENCWDYLRKTRLPVFIYGMGDGALKIMSVMEQYRIPVAGFFASDEFVRGHYFEQHKVHTLSEVEGFLDEFVIVLAFAAGYPSLVEKINALAKRHTLLAPDVPVAGSGLFTYEYCLEHANELEKVYSLLADETSKKVFSAVLNFKISGKVEYLDSITTERSDVYEKLISLSVRDVYVDLGAYNGDTVSEFVSAANGKYEKIFVLEPDRKNFKKLLKATENLCNIEAINAAAWESDATLIFAGKAGRQSAVSLDGSGVETPARSVDSLLGGSPCSIIKMDVEGAEREAILGAEKTIKEFSPCLLISLYHRNEDLFALPLMIHEMNPDYKFYIRHELYIPAWETNLYAVKKS